MAKKNKDVTDRGFDSERDLSRAFSPESCIRAEFGYKDWNSWQAPELEGLFGIPDHIAVFWRTDRLGRRVVRTFAFELKRDHWRRALMQAYRYASFADYSLVVLDNMYVHRAVAHLEEFKKSNIGLLSVRVDGKVRWHFRPHRRTPYSRHMRHLLDAALSVHLFGNKDGEPNKSMDAYVSDGASRGLKRRSS